MIKSSYNRVVSRTENTGYIGIGKLPMINMLANILTFFKGVFHVPIAFDIASLLKNEHMA